MESPEMEILERFFAILKGALKGREDGPAEEWLLRTSFIMELLRSSEAMTSESIEDVLSSFTFDIGLQVDDMMRDAYASAEDEEEQDAVDCVFTGLARMLHMRMRRVLTGAVIRARLIERHVQDGSKVASADMLGINIDENVAAGILTRFEDGLMSHQKIATIRGEA